MHGMTMYPFSIVKHLGLFKFGAIMKILYIYFREIKVHFSVGNILRSRIVI